MSERANPFSDLGDFAPAPAKPKADRAVIDQVAEEHGFPSRQPAKEIVPPSPPETPTHEEKLPQKVFRVTPAQNRALKQRCAQLDMTMQDVVIEGINMLLVSKGLPPI